MAGLYRGNRHCPALVGSTLLTVMMAGCASNDNAGGGGPDTRFSSVVQESAHEDSRSKIAGAAKLPAVSGTDNDNVVQSSHGIDDISVTATYNDNGTITFRVSSTAGGWTFNSGNPGEEVTVLSRRKAEGWNAISLLLETDEGKRWVDVYTDIEPPEGDESTLDTDYLSGGIWVYVPEDDTDTAAYEFGVFVHGSDPFDHNNLAALTGPATYKGDASGLYSNPDANSNAFFSAMSELTANFGDDDETISGRLHTFMIGGRKIENLELMLGSADLETAADGTGLFNGVTSATYDGSDFSGNWGGRFYGNGDAATDHPGSVAGTFGAADENDRAFIGVFSARKAVDDEAQ